MTIRYFRRVEERINKSAWLIEQKSVFTEYDEDADVGFIGGVSNSKTVRYFISRKSCSEKTGIIDFTTWMRKTT